MDRFRLLQEEYDKVAAFRHDLHMHPELSGEEYRTTGKIREFLSQLPGCRILDLPVRTGLVAQIPADEPKGEIMLRADIDALPQTEMTDYPWRSQNPDVMHACGHDVHTSSLAGAAMVLCRKKQEGELKATIDLVFQPAEEGTTGARMMIDAGLFDVIHPDVCFGMHNWPSVEIGRVVCREGALMAAKRNFDVMIYGEGGHGSMPHLNTDPIVCAAAVVQSLQTVVSRNVNPLESAVLSINMISGGTVVNRVADEVLIKGTIRSLSDAVLDRAVDRVKAIVGNTAAAYECRSEIIWKERIPAVWNSPQMTAAALCCARETGSAVTDAPPSLASEDFSLYREYAPSFFFWTGSHTPGREVTELHKPQFFADDEVLRYASELYASCASYYEQEE